MKRSLQLLGLVGALSSGACEGTVESPLAEARSALAQEEHARLRLRFLLDGRPYPATLVVASEHERAVFADVREIDALVPRVATYSLTMKDATSGAVTFKDVIPTLTLPEDGLDGLIHLVEGAQARDFEPMLLIEERGANARVRSRAAPTPQSGQAFTLHAEVQGTPGKQVILDTILESSSPARGYTCPAPCPLIYPEPSALGVDCSIYCYGCSSTSVLKGDHWVGNHNLCSLTLDSGGQAQRQAILEPLPAGRGGVALLAALRNDAAVTVHSAALQDRAGTRLELRAPIAARAYPDFVVPHGDFSYELRVADPSLEAGSALFTLPMPVEEGRNRTFLLNLPALGVLPPFTAWALGDSRLGLALHRAEASFERGVVQVEADFDGSDGAIGWVMVVLPKEAPVRSVALTSRRSCGRHELQPGTDYVHTRLDAVQLLTLLLREDHDSFAIRLGSRSSRTTTP